MNKFMNFHEVSTIIILTTYFIGDSWTAAQEFKYVSLNNLKDSEKNKAITIEFNSTITKEKDFKENLQACIVSEINKKLDSHSTPTTPPPSTETVKDPEPNRKRRKRAANNDEKLDLNDVKFVDIPEMENGLIRLMLFIGNEKSFSYEELESAVEKCSDEDAQLKKNKMRHYKGAPGSWMAGIASDWWFFFLLLSISIVVMVTLSFCLYRKMQRKKIPRYYQR